MCNIPECNACHELKDLRQSDWKFNICGQSVQQIEVERIRDRWPRHPELEQVTERHVFQVGGVQVEVCAHDNVLQILRDIITAPDWQAPKKEWLE